MTHCRELTKNRPEHMFIGRHDEKYPYWRLRFRHKGKIIYRESFFDATYGSNKGALVAALKKREAIARKANVDLKTHWNTCKIKGYRYTQKPGKRSKTGIVGVVYYETKQNRYYRASISLTKYHETVKSFNCDTLGDKEALRLATEQRALWEKQLKEGDHAVRGMA